MHQFCTNAALRLGGVFVLIFGHVLFKDVFHGAGSWVAHAGYDVREGVVTDPVCPGSLTLKIGFARALPQGQTPVNLRVLEDLALLLAFVRPRWAPEKGSTLLLSSSIFARFFSRLMVLGVEVVCAEVEAGEACRVKEDVHGRDPPFVHR